MAPLPYPCALPSVAHGPLSSPPLAGGSGAQGRCLWRGETLPGEHWCWGGMHCPAPSDRELAERGLK